MCTFELVSELVKKLTEFLTEPDVTRLQNEHVYVTPFLSSGDASAQHMLLALFATSDVSV